MRQLFSVGYPAGAVAIAMLLQQSRPAWYVAWTLALFMFSPFVRRVIDAHYGWDPQSPVLLAPLLAAAVAVLTVVRQSSRLDDTRMLPLLLAGGAVLGGAIVGVFVSPPALVAYAALSWGAPIALGLYVMVRGDAHREVDRAVGRVLIGGVMVVGCYGLLQYVAPPVWDRVWMIETRMDSIGAPLPLRVRVFSTLNAPGPLAQFLSAALLMILARRERVRWGSVAVGSAAFILSLARSAWLGAAIGLIVLLLLGQRTLRRIALPLVLAAGVAAVAWQAAPNGQARLTVERTVGARITTLGTLSLDESYRARRYLVPVVLADIRAHPLGRGLGATLVGGARGLASARLADQGLYMDNGVMEIVLVLGWLGGAAFLLSAAAAVAHASFAPSSVGRAGRVGYLAAATALLAQVAGGTVFAGVGGAMFWLAVALANHRVQPAGRATLAARPAPRTIVAARVEP